MTLILDLPPEKEAALKEQARAAGVSAEEFALETLSRALGIPAPEAETEADDGRPIWEVIADNMKDVPDEDLDRLPRDSAAQVDHYLYGHPKR